MAILKVNLLTRKKTTFISTFILQIFCFIQICSFVHFHHTHSDDELRIIFSIHPVDHHTENHNDHHSNNHNHCEWEHCDVDLTFIRPTPKIVTELPTKLNLTASLLIKNKPDLSCIIQKFYSDLSQQKVFFSSISPRSPPHLSWSFHDILVFS